MVLRILAGSPHRPVLAVTPPDSRRGRGRRPGSPPVAEAASELGIEVAQTPDASGPDAVRRIAAAAPELGVVCAFGQLIHEPLLSRLELLNVHPSLLPRWRGAAPVERAIMAGDDETGATIMKVTAGLDSGPIAARARLPIGPGDDYGTLAARLAPLGGQLAVAALDSRAAGELALESQDDEAATYAEKIGPGDRRLDPGRPAPELERTVRALRPHIGAHVELVGGDRLGVIAAVAEAGGPAPGAFDDELRLGCAEGALRLVEVRPPGGRAMEAAAYLRGHPRPRSV